MPILMDIGNSSIATDPLKGTFNTYYSSFSNLLNSLVIAIIIFFIGFIIGRIVGKLLTRLLQELQINKLSSKIIKGRLLLDQFLGNLIAYSIYFIFIIITLDYLKIGKLVMQFMITFVLIILTVSFILGLRDFFPNFLAGLTLFAQKKIKVGDKIEVLDIYGKIENIGMLTTKIQTFKKETVYIPNSIFLKNKLKKFIDSKKDDDKI